MLACRPPEIPWLTTQIISVRAPSEQTLRHGPFCAAARPMRTPGVKRRAGGGVSLARAFRSAGRAQKKRSRPGNCARRRSLEMQVLRGRSRLEPLVSLQGASLVGAGHCRGVFRTILRRPQRRMYPVSGDGEAEEHAIFAGRLLSACGACSTTHAVHRCVRAVKLQPTRGRRELTR